MMQETTDTTSPAYQRLTWDALRKSINGVINKVNEPNIRNILPELFQENLMRGRGLLCRSVMKSQMASPAFTPVYAALMAVVNTKFPEIVELLLHRTVRQFKRAYKRNDKPVCMATAKMVAHLVNQGVVHELLALELLMLLLEEVSDDSVELAVQFTQEVGAALTSITPAGLHTVFDRFRAVLHEGQIDKRVQFMIEALFSVRKQGFEAAGHPAIPPGLDLVEADDQICHELSLDDALDAHAALDVFKVDPEYETHEKEYEAVKRELLGEGTSDEEDAGEDASEDESDEEEQAARVQDITDATNTDSVNLRRTIYLTIMSALDFEEAGHKLLKIQIPPGQEHELVEMLIECCSQERTFLRYYALLAARFCMLRREYQGCFEDCFVKQYEFIHRLETNKLRNVAKLFAHLLGTDAITWHVLQVVSLTEDDTSSSSRIFVKILFQELTEHLGLSTMNTRLWSAGAEEWNAGLFPRSSTKDLRFSINFFTSIGLGGLTDNMREALKELPAILAVRRQAEMEARAAAANDTSSSSSSDSSSSDSSSSSSGSSSSSSSGSSSSDSSSSDSDADSPPPREKLPPPPPRRSGDTERRRYHSSERSREAPRVASH